MDRRSFLASVPALSTLANLLGAEQAPATAMGVVIHSFGMRRSAEATSPLATPLGFLEHCRAFAAGGVQTTIGAPAHEEIARIRAFLERHGMYLEGSIRLPRAASKVETFEREVRAAKDCGATVLRTVLLGGRRYETFRAADDFRRFVDQSRRSLALARPVVERHQVLLAIENHKDWRAEELVDLLRSAPSPAVGVCLDTGNSIALLETPAETLDALAPYTFTTHIKDMGLDEYPDGFLLSEVPLGTGFVDLPAIVRRLRAVRPSIRFNLEMITRDPLRVPCLTPGYWVTLDSVPGRRLAEMLALVRRRRQELPRVESLPQEQRLRREEENVRACLLHAAQRLL